jgi:hypothetical protein
MSTMTCLAQHAIRRDLQAFASAAQLTPASDRQAWKALDARWGTLAEALRQHDVLSQPEDGSATVIPALLESCTEGFAKAARCVDDDARAALAVRLAAMREWLRRGSVDRSAVVWSIPATQLTKIVPWAVYGLSSEARESVIRTGGPVFRLVWLFTRRGFERQQRKAFRYVAEA